MASGDSDRCYATAFSVQPDCSATPASLSFYHSLEKRRWVECMLCGPIGVTQAQLLGRLKMAFYCSCTLHCIVGPAVVFIDRITLGVGDRALPVVAGRAWNTFTSILLFAQRDVSLWASIGFTQRAQRTAFTRPSITLQKVNRFG